MVSLRKSDDEVAYVRVAKDTQQVNKCLNDAVNTVQLQLHGVSRMSKVYSKCDVYHRELRPTPPLVQ